MQNLNPFGRRVLFTEGPARTRESQFLEGVLECVQGSVLDAEHMQHCGAGGIRETD